MKSLRRNRLTKTLDPDGPFVQKWNKMALISCLTALCIDPLLSYINVVDAPRLCLYIDQQLAITFSLLRTLVDAFYVLHIFLQLRTGFGTVNIRYLRSYFLMDLLSILPVPQVVTVVAIRTKLNPVRMRPVTVLYMGQNLLRAVRIGPLLNKFATTSGISMAWSGAASNFLFYLLASHVIGSFWYLTSVEQMERCWHNACRDDNDCKLDNLYCGRGDQGGNSFLVPSCSSLQSGKPAFNYGIFLDALRIHLYPDFFRRFFYSFVWGLRNLSSLGQNLETSNCIGENLFVVVISITGLILFSFLAGNIQRYLQYLTVKKDEMSSKLRVQEQWMSRSKLPRDLRERVRQHEQYKWHKNRGVDEESLIDNLPKDLRRDIKRHQCRSLLTTVPMFEKMDQIQLDALCYRLKPVLYTAGTYIFHEGEPVDEMLFVMRGKVVTKTKNSGESLKAGNLCGEELLTWASDPNSSSTLPISTTTLIVMDDVEAFRLSPDDLKCIVSQFRTQQQLHHILRQVGCGTKDVQFPGLEDMGCLHHTGGVAKILQEEDGIDHSDLLPELMIKLRQPNGSSDFFIEGAELP